MNPEEDSELQSQTNNDHFSQPSNQKPDSEPFEDNPRPKMEHRINELKNQSSFMSFFLRKPPPPPPQPLAANEPNLSSNCAKVSHINAEEKKENEQQKMGEDHLKTFIEPVEIVEVEHDVDDPHAFDKAIPAKRPKTFTTKTIIDLSEDANEPQPKKHSGRNRTDSRTSNQQNALNAERPFHDESIATDRSSFSASFPSNTPSTCLKDFANIPATRCDTLLKTPPKPKPPEIPLPFAGFNLDDLDPSLREELFFATSSAKADGSASSAKNGIGSSFSGIMEKVFYRCIVRFNVQHGPKMFNDPTTFIAHIAPTTTIQEFKQSLSSKFHIPAPQIIVTQDDVALFDSTRLGSLNLPQITLPKNHQNLTPKGARVCGDFSLYTTASWKTYSNAQQAKQQEIIQIISQRPTPMDGEARNSKAGPKISIVPNLNLSIKTSLSKNNSFQVSIASTATIADLLALLVKEHGISTGGRVFFDGDALAPSTILSACLEDDDMLEVKL